MDPHTDKVLTGGRGFGGAGNAGLRQHGIIPCAVCVNPMCEGRRVLWYADFYILSKIGGNEQ